jgi:hypothetical protein
VVLRIGMGVVTRIIRTVQLIVTLLSWFGKYVDAFRDIGVNTVTEVFRFSRRFGGHVAPVSA